MTDNRPHTEILTVPAIELDALSLQHQTETPIAEPPSL